MPVKKTENKGPEDGKGDREHGVFKGLATLSSMGIAMVLCTFIGLLMGIYIDKYFGTKPWFTIIFLVLGIVAGFKNMYEMIKKYGATGG
jgi:ATP synthase protein I